MELNKSQAILLAYIQNQQQRAGKRLVREREVPRDIVTSFGLLQLELRREGVVMSEAEAIGTLQQLVGMDIGIKIRSTEYCINDENEQMTIVTLRYSPPAKLRMKLWREEQKRLGRSVKTFYLTQDESEKVSSFIEKLREKKMPQSLICYDTFPVKDVLKLLLLDHTTGKNIIFATDQYLDKNPSLAAKTEITVDMLTACADPLIQPRVTKSLEEQFERTRQKAEVFTPSWLCNRMNNHCDEEWFGRSNVFNVEIFQSWITNKEPVAFGKDLDWRQYVQSPRLEITCGEAPYIASRYDAATGDTIPTENRIGILDRKLRIVNENTKTERTWLTWTKKAFQSVYGYEYQGDNLLIARINLLLTFYDNFKYRWNKEPSVVHLKTIANIVSWNLWQMNGITNLIPFAKKLTNQ